VAFVVEIITRLNNRPLKELTFFLHVASPQTEHHSASGFVSVSAGLPP